MRLGSDRKPSEVKTHARVAETFYSDARKDLPVFQTIAKKEPDLKFKTQAPFIDDARD